MAQNQKVELEQVNENDFRVLKLINRLEPAVGSCIDRREVKELLDRSARGKLNVVIVPLKG